MTSWQGGAQSIVQTPEEVGPGEYRTTAAGPRGRHLEDILRLHTGDQVLGLPVFMPEDPAIPAAEISADPTDRPPFQLDSLNLLREQKDDVPGWLTTVSFIAVLVLWVALIAALVWGLRRSGSASGPTRLRPPPTPARPRSAPGTRTRRPSPGKPSGVRRRLVPFEVEVGQQAVEPGGQPPVRPPHSLITAGSSTRRTRVASISTAIVRPTRAGAPWRCRPGRRPRRRRS